MKVTIGEVAAVLNRTPATVSRYELGEQMPVGEVAVAYGNLLEHWDRQLAGIEP